MWRYELAFGLNKSRRLVVKHGRVVGPDGADIVRRPSSEEADNPLLLSQTALEQVSENQRFRPVVDLLTSVRYLNSRAGDDACRRPRQGRTS